MNLVNMTQFTLEVYLYELIETTYPDLNFKESPR